MEILKVIRHTDGGENYLKNAINYDFKEKTEEDEKLIETVGYGVNGTNPEYAYNQMYAVKKYFGKTEDNPLMHFVVSFDNKVDNAETASEYTKNIADYFKNDYQMVTAIHQENQGNSKYHAHIVMNSVNYNNGKLYHSGIGELKQFAMHIHDVTDNYCKIEFK